MFDVFTCPACCSETDRVSNPKPIISPLEHQDVGTSFLRDNHRAALFDEQGLGKSKQLIDALTAEIGAGTIQAGLIICPNGLKSNWAGEVEKFSSLPYAVFGSGRSARRVAFQSLRAGFYIINYEAIDTELPSLKALLRFKPMALVLDESHRIKSPDAKTTRAVLALRSYAARRYILTGTPVANKPDDLWSQMYFLDDGLSLGMTFEDFQTTYGSSGGGYRNMEQLRERIAGTSLRRTKAEALTLPDKVYRRIVVDLSARQDDMYQQLRRELELWVHDLKGEEILETADAILARMVRLAQLASNPSLIDSAYVETPAKVSMLDELLSEYFGRSDTQKVIVWTSFVENIKALMNRYKQWSPVAIHGDVSNSERDSAVLAFRSDPTTRLLIANPAAAREGLTLTEANVAIYLDRTFNLVDYLQSQDRIHRISQTQECEIVLLIARNTVDEFIDFTLEQKRRLACYAQDDTDAIDEADLQLRKPEILRALLGPQDLTAHAPASD
jgi:SWI/SNF-related matrix-associated actin-dependent regulator 1 of chromatin subfamily A